MQLLGKEYRHWMIGFVVLFCCQTKTVPALQAVRSDTSANQTTSDEAPEPRVQSGHSGDISTIAFSRDYRFFSTGSEDGTVKLWDAASQRLIRTMLAGRYWIYRLSFSDDGRYLAAGSGDHSAYVWDLQTGKQMTPYTGLAGAVTALAFNDDATLLAIGSTGNVPNANDSILSVQELASRRQVMHTNEIARVTDLAFLPSSRSLVVSDAHEISLWELDTGRSHHYQAYQGTVERVVVSPDGSIVASTEESFSAVTESKATRYSNPSLTVRTWSVSSSKTDLTSLTTVPKLEALAFTANGGLLGVRSENYGWDLDNHIHSSGNLHIGIWDARSGENQSMSPVTVPGADHLSAAAGNSIIALSRARSFELVNAETSVSTHAAIELPLAVRGLSLSPNGKFLAVGVNGGFVTVWDLDQGEPVRWYSHQDVLGDSVNSLSFPSSDDNLFASFSSGSIFLWDLPQNKLLSRLRAPDPARLSPGQMLDTIEELGSSRPSAQTALSVCIDGDCSRRAKDIQLRTAAFSPGGLVAYGGNRTGSYTTRYIAILKKKDGAPIELFPKDERDFEYVNSVSFGSETTLAVGYESGNLDLWDIRGLKLAHTVHAHSGRLNAVAFSRDGSLLASASDDKTVKLWDTSLNQVDQSMRFESAARSAAFSSDRQFLAVGTADGTVWIRNVHSHELVQMSSAHTSAVTALAFSADNKLLISGSEDATVKFWKISDSKLLASAVSFSMRDWLVFSPNGFFDGSQHAWHFVPFSFPSEPLRLYEPEQFFNEFYQPHLLADTFASGKPIVDVLKKEHDSRASISISQYRATHLPELKFVEPASSVDTAERRMNIVIQVNDSGSGMRDLRVFRNQSLVHFEHGDLHPNVSDKSYRLSIPVKVVAGKNEISAYVFNHDDVRSTTASLVVNGDASLKRPGRVYIVAFGVKHYSNQNFDLQWPEADVSLISQSLDSSYTQLRSYQPVVFKLVNGNATKANMLAAFRMLAGELGKDISAYSPELRKLKPAEPEDAVIFYFSGHGAARGGEYYLLPYDLGYTGPKTVDDAGRAVILSHSLSSREMQAIFEHIDAGKMMLIVDACQSGQLLESSDKRIGPMNSRGLAQLAFEKGAFVLAAAQSVGAALELNRFGHGVLTYALVEKGLNEFKADIDPVDGTITAGEWLHYATQDVPAEISAIASHNPATDLAQSRGILYEDAPILAQIPRAYYRRELGESWVVKKK